MCDKIVLAVAFGPSVILIVWALWIHFTTEDPPFDDTWGLQ